MKDEHYIITPSVNGWNHRVVRYNTGQDDEYLEICEVYYDADGTPNGHTDGVPVLGDTLDSIRWVLEQMQRAATMPVIDALQSPPTGGTPQDD